VKVHDVHIPQGGGSLSVILQLEPAMEGQVTDALLSVLGSSWSNCKMVIAVDRASIPFPCSERRVN